MAKKITTIACPHCGSTEKTNLSPGTYRCRRCGTEYFLAEEESRIEVRHTGGDIPADGGGNASRQFLKIFLGVAVIGVSLVLGAVLLLWVLRRDRIPQQTARSDRQRYDYFVHDARAVDCGGEPYIFCLGLKRILAGGPEGEFVWFFYNTKEDSIENLHPVEGATKHDDSRFSRFTDGNDYLLINRKLVCRIDPANREMTDLTRHICETRSELSTGIASASIENDYFIVVNNAGDAFIYYPAIDGVYTQAEVYQQKEDIAFRLHSKVVKRETPPYKFVNGKGGYRQLVLQNPAGAKPKRDIFDQFFGDSDVWDGNGTVLAPGRRFFDPKIVYADPSHLLISVHATAAEDAPTHIQSLDPATGDVQWSTQVYDPGRHAFRHGDYYGETILAGDTYIIREDHRLYMTLDTLGNYRELNWKRGSITPPTSIPGSEN